MPGSRPIYYWDTCLFLAWIKDEQRPSGEMAGFREVIDRAKRRDAIIMTSVLTSTEVLQSKMPAGLDTLFHGLMKRIEQKAIDIKIARLAHDLRDYFAVRASSFDNKTLSTPDALHLATAIIYRATAFHTFDASNGRNSLGLLPLSGNVAGPCAHHRQAGSKEPRAGPQERQAMSTGRQKAPFLPVDDEQSERFIKAARELECDDDPERFKETVRKLAKAPPARNAPSKSTKARKE